MTLRWQCVVIDTDDPGRAVAAFWEAALGWRRTHEDADEIVLGAPCRKPAGRGRTRPAHRAGPRREVDEEPPAPRPPTDDQASEVARLESLGARRVDVGQGDDVTWVVLADPGDNEFCVLRAYRPGEV